ncbi:response regulator, partial [Candidatus Woesearchaeota archaeon]|nr:response regulator [Candidatus Woesearchaeota archaeon]
FIVELPFQQASPPITPPAQPVKLPSAPLRGLNILIVEDNHINQTIARAVVEKMGATVTVAEDGSQALVLLNSQPPPTYDVILMDIQMPVMDGLTATRHIRSNADFTDLPILAVSAHTLSSDREASLAAGMNAHLAKPLRNEELVRSILQFLPERSLQRLPQSTREGPLNLSILETGDERLQALFKDLGRALARIDGSETLYCEIATLFLAEHAGDIEKIRDCLASQLYDKARSTVHTLASLADTLGLSPLVVAAHTLEAALKQDPTNELEPAMAHLENQLEYASKNLRRLMRSGAV